MVSVLIRNGEKQPRSAEERTESREEKEGEVEGRKGKGLRGP